MSWIPDPWNRSRQTSGRLLPYPFHDRFGQRIQRVEARSARNMVDRLTTTRVRQVIYLSGIVNAEELSAHLSSRQQVSPSWQTGHSPDHPAGRHHHRVGQCVLRDHARPGGEIAGDDHPRWLETRSQPIAVRNVLSSDRRIGPGGYQFDIGGHHDLQGDVAGIRRIQGLKRFIWTVR